MTEQTLGPYICTRCGAERKSEVHVCETEAARVQRAVDDNDKHMTALILWCKQRKWGPHCLTDMLACGSTVAGEVWRKYENGWLAYDKIVATRENARDDTITEAERKVIDAAMLLFECDSAEMKPLWWDSIRPKTTREEAFYALLTACAVFHETGVDALRREREK